LFQKTTINKHSILDTNINHSFIFNSVLEVVLLLSHDQIIYIMTFIFFQIPTTLGPPNHTLNQYSM
jgi:hypothetical protein